VQQLVANVIMFVPLGQFLRETVKSKQRKWDIGCFAFFVSLAIEIIQYIFKIGTFEVDDLIHNTWGAVIGCCIYESRMKYKWEEKIKTLMPLELFAAGIVLISTYSLRRCAFR
jgi:glycopeptide antibiotics resistance protein